MLLPSRTSFPLLSTVLLHTIFDLFEDILATKENITHHSWRYDRNNFTESAKKSFVRKGEGEKLADLSKITYC